jgi:hypothetical protein
MKKKDELEKGTITRAAEDEPVFVLRGADRLSPRVIRYWIDRAKMRGVSEEKIEEVRELLTELEKWQTENPDKVKLPD